MAAEFGELNKLHKDLATYLQDTFRTYNAVKLKLDEDLNDKKVSVAEYVLTLDKIKPPPALVATAATFLKNNNIMVDLEDLGKDLDDFNKQLDKVTDGTLKIGTSPLEDDDDA